MNQYIGTVPCTFQFMYIGTVSGCEPEAMETTSADKDLAVMKQQPG